MSELQKLRPISKAELSAKGVSALSDRPNTRNQYGVGGLSPQELKAWFDKLGVFLADKINELQRAISEEGAADHIKIDTEQSDMQTLGDLVRAVYDGRLAAYALYVYVAGYGEGTLAQVLTSLHRYTRENREDIDTLFEKAGFGVKAQIAPGTNTLTLKLLDRRLQELSSAEIDITATTARIADGAVTMPKIAVKSLTTDAFADQSISTRTLQPQAVTEDKLSDELLLLLASLRAGAVSGIRYDPSTGKLTVTSAGGSEFTAEIKINAANIDADPSGTAQSKVAAHDASSASHADIRKLISELTSRLNSIADSDDNTLDQLSEIVLFIKSNKDLIDSITTSKVNYTDIANNLTTNNAKKALSAAQGVAIKALIDALQQNKVSVGEIDEQIERALSEAKESGEFDGESVSIIKTEESAGSGGINIVTFSNGSKLNVKNGYTPYIGDNGSWFIGTVDTTIKARGADGESVTVSKVTESTASGGNNVVTFSDGKALAIKNGKDGQDYILTEADKENIAAMAAALIKEKGVVGYVDENNNIVISGNLAGGTYTVKYEMADGSAVDVGELVIDAEVVTPTYTNLFVPSEAIINKRVSNSFELKDIAGHFVTAFIDISNKVPFTDTTKIYVKGANFNAASSGTNQTKIFTYKSIPDTPYSGAYSVVQGANITPIDEGNGVISVSNQALSFPYDVKYMVLTLKVSDSTLTAADLENIVITIDEPIN